MRREPGCTCGIGTDYSGSRPIRYAYACTLHRQRREAHEAAQKQAAASEKMARAMAYRARAESRKAKALERLVEILGDTGVNAIERLVWVAEQMAEREKK